MLKNVAKVKVSISKPIKCLAVVFDYKVPAQEIHICNAYYSTRLQRVVCWDIVLHLC